MDARTPQPRPANRRGIAIALIAISMLLTACVGSDPAPTTAPPTVMPSAVDPPSEEELLAEATATIQGFLDDLEAMRATGANDPTMLLDHASEQVATETTAAVQHHYDEGLHVVGAPTLVAVTPDETNFSNPDSFQVLVCFENPGLPIINSEGEDVSVPPAVTLGAIALLLERQVDGALKIVEQGVPDEESPDPCGL